MRTERVGPLLVCAALLGILAQGATDTVLILHTNDLHDHIRADLGGRGGMPYVSGYIHTVCSERKDTLVLDAGDVAQKGDMLAWKTESAAMYEAMKKAGCQAGTPGNHDFAYGLERLKENMALGGFPLLCVNCVGNEGSVDFQPSASFDVDGVKVGVVGATVEPQGKIPGRRILNPQETAEALEAEAKRLDEEDHLVVAVCHLPTSVCAKISTQAPDIDVFISGHSHEETPEPIVVPATGALIVQTGQYGHYVGRLELAIDLDTEKVVDYKGELVEMSKGQTPLDEEMIAWAAAKESEICPEASRVLGRAAQPIEGDRLARLYAEAIREKAGAEVGLEVPSRLRSGIEAGVIDYNAVFKTYAAERSRNVVVASFGGRLILDCLENVRTNRGSIQWSGFTAEVDYDKPLGQRVVHSSLDPERTYDVALSAGCLMDLGRLKIIPPKTQSRAAGFTVVDALADAIAARGEIE